VHKQVVKGGDDLRNDAVIQQLFRTLNDLFPKSGDDAIPPIRTYRVVPLSPLAGVVEWVSNTVTLSKYLVGGDGMTGAHGKYRPQDITSRQCRAEMDNTRKVHQGATELNQKLLDTFKRVCQQFKPVGHCFLLDHFQHPSDWYNARQAFVKSAAVASIVGYCVGLGDRHPNNILIDTVTGELVHIDFGICFDMGKDLSIPETVPFRLTRDIVSAMGPLGVHDAFTSTCRATLRCLRQHSNVVIAIIEAFVYDPLYKWSTSSSRLERMGSKKIVDSKPISKNDSAERAILSVRRKLQGFVDHHDLSPVPLEIQVDRLITIARDRTRLSQLFAGWQAWM
jgi:ataxia telangiectasia mutated family protein